VGTRAEAVIRVATLAANITIDAKRQGLADLRCTWRRLDSVFGKELALPPGKQPARRAKAGA
jgi:hypothetical protein